MTEYIFDGRRWLSQVTTTRRSARVPQPPSSTQALSFWHPPQLHDDIKGQGKAFEQYKAQPCFHWVGEWTASPRNAIAECVKKAKGRIIPLCVYGFPRDAYSAGGFNSMKTYSNWIDGISAGLGSAPCILILEPDALGEQTKMRDGTTPEVALSYAVDKFEAANAKTAIFVDASHWVDPATQSQRLRRANLAKAAGFATNVSNFRTTPDQVAYCEQVVAQLARDGLPGKSYVIDTGRNGNGDLTAAFGPAAAPG